MQKAGAFFIAEWSARYTAVLEREVRSEIGAGRLGSPSVCIRAIMKNLG